MKIIKHFNNEINISEIKELEWIETNGLGGWSSSTISGLNTRKYHGVLVPSLDPPVDRRVYLSRLDETLSISGIDFPLSTRQFPQTLWPEGYKTLKSFEKDFFPSTTFEFKIDGLTVQLKKTITMIHNKNSTLICYELFSPKNMTMKLEPFIAAREYHSLTQANSQINPKVLELENCIQIEPYVTYPPLKIYYPKGSYVQEPGWYYHFEYEIEKERGLDYCEDLFKYGQIYFEMKPQEKYYVLATIENETVDCAKAFEEELNRRKNLLDKLPHRDSFTEILALAADQFIVEKEENALSIIAGYHWFTDWGRDTMIALPGLCLHTGRIEEAKRILIKYADFVDEGMLPNRFDDKEDHPEYNTVDATLWYFIAIYKTYQASKDVSLIKKLYPILKEIIDWHYKGTRYGIKVTKDGLVRSGELGTQLTWMDAKIGDKVITPRIGKAVEINALWYNALRIFSEFSEILGHRAIAETYKKKATAVEEVFLSTFWDSNLGYLYDLIEDNGQKISTLRPNQIFALSLPFKLVPDHIGKAILKIIEDNLLTPYGLRTLDRDNLNYHPKYLGNQFERDHAYHQGTVWLWLIGPYMSAVIRYYGKEKKDHIIGIIEKLKLHLEEAGIGTMSEIFDADPPHHYRGCIAQAWSIAEVMRVYMEDVIKS